MVKNSSKQVQKSTFYPTIRKAVLVLRAVNHKLRQQILDMIEKNGRMTVTDIYVKNRIEQSVASQHLAILRRAGIVTTKRDGKFIYYSVDEKKVEEVGRLAEEMTQD